MAKEYWTTKSGRKIDIDIMDIDHLRNTLKMIVRQNKHTNQTCPNNIDEAIDLIALECEYDAENFGCR